MAPAPHANGAFGSARKESGSAESNSAGSNHGSASPASQASALPIKPPADARPSSNATPTPTQPAPIRTSSGSLITPKNLGQRGPSTVADAVAASLGSKRERKRKRIHYSCAECHRRKHKCDRQTPCQPCIDRGLGDSCRPFEDGDQFGDMRDRVQRLEDIVEGLAVAQAELAKELSNARKNGFEYVEMESSADEQDGPDQLTADGQSRPKPRKKRRVIRPDTVRGMEREELFNSEAQAIAALKGETIDSSSNQKPSSGVRYDEGGNPLEGGLARDGDSWYGALALPSVSRGVIETEINGERLELGANFPRFPASVKLHRLIHEGGAPENILNQLMNCLPNKQDSDRLLDIFFRDINHTRLPIHEGTFRQSYEELMEFRWGNAKEERGDDGARHVPFLAFLFSVLAIAMRSLPESLGTEAEAKKGAMRLYHACRRTINIASTIRVDHIDLVLAHLFAARFLICQRQSAESWSLLGTAIRAAQAIGLHRDGSKLGLDAITTERRRRLWALIFHMDKTTSILLGRPQAIQEFHCDTLPPSDVDIDTMPRAARPYVPRTKAQPHKPPGVVLFVAIRHELARLTGKVVDHFQNLASPRRYADVIALDEELEKFRRDLPDLYRMDRGEDGSCVGTDKSFDDVCSFLPLHRYLLNIEYNYIRIALHRPYVLRNSEKYSHSRTAAFTSAMTDRMVRHEYRKDVKWEPDRARKVHMGGLYRLFNATMMIGIALLLNPNGPEANDFLSYLDEFIELHRTRGTSGGDTDQCTKREVKIIELFRAKARDPSWCATSVAAAKRDGSTNGDKQSAARAATATNPASGKNGADRDRRSGTTFVREEEIKGLEDWAKTSNAPPRFPEIHRAPGAEGKVFNINHFFDNASRDQIQSGLAGTGSAASGSNRSAGSVTPPPFVGLLARGGLALGAGAMGMGLSGVNVSSIMSNETNGDLAQNIFDQLGGLENSFGMLNQAPADGLTIKGGVGLGYGTGTDGMQSSVGFDPSVFDLSSFWNNGGEGNDAGNAGTGSSGGGDESSAGGARRSGTSSDSPAANGALLGVSPSALGGTPSITIPATANAHDSRHVNGVNTSAAAASSSTFRSVAHPHLRALQAAAVNGTLHGQHLGSDSALANLLQQGEAGISSSQAHAPTGSDTPRHSSSGPGSHGAGQAGDWGLLPWGGLIEAIAQSSHGIDANGTQASTAAAKPELAARSAENGTASRASDKSAAKTASPSGAGAGKAGGVASAGREGGGMGKGTGPAGERKAVGASVKAEGAGKDDKTKR